MAVSGYYLAARVSHTILPIVRAYVACFREHFLPVFDGLNDKAETIADSEFAKLMAQPAGAGLEDPADAAELATDRALAFYETMWSMRQSSLNVFAAGLYHLVEQQLAALGYDATFQAMGVPVPDTKLVKTVTWYQQYLRLDLKTLRHWRIVDDELRCLANAVKHGEGSSAKKLRKLRPELFEDPQLIEFGGTVRVARPLLAPLAGDCLFVTPAIFDDYAEAAVSLLEEVQTHFLERQDEEYPDVT